MSPTRRWRKKKKKEKGKKKNSKFKVLFCCNFSALSCADSWKVHLFALAPIHRDSFKISRDVSQEGCQRQSRNQQPVCRQPHRESHRESCEEQPGYCSDERCGPSQQTLHQQQQRVLWYRFQGKHLLFWYSYIHDNKQINSNQSRLHMYILNEQITVIIKL